MDLKVCGTIELDQEAKLRQETVFPSQEKVSKVVNSLHIFPKRQRP